MTEDNNYRISRLEDEMIIVRKDLKEIMGTHLPNIKIEIEQLRGEVKALATSVKIYGGIIMIALTALIGLVITG